MLLCYCVKLRGTIKHNATERERDKRAQMRETGLYVCVCADWGGLLGDNLRQRLEPGGMLRFKNSKIFLPFDVGLRFNPKCRERNGCGRLMPSAWGAFGAKGSSGRA